MKITKQQLLGFLTLWILDPTKSLLKLLASEKNQLFDLNKHMFQKQSRKGFKVSLNIV